MSNYTSYALYVHMDYTFVGRVCIAILFYLDHCDITLSGC